MKSTAMKSTTWLASTIGLAAGLILCTTGCSKDAESKAPTDTKTAKAGEGVAIKVLTQDVGEEEVERFRMEAELAQKVDHPNIIRVFIFGRTPDNLMYLAMEFVKGRELRESLIMELVLLSVWFSCSCRIL